MRLGSLRDDERQVGEGRVDWRRANSTARSYHRDVESAVVSASEASEERLKSPTIKMGTSPSSAAMAKT